MENRGIPAGVLGAHYAISHSYGYYRSSAVTGVYDVLVPEQYHDGVEYIMSLLQPALAKTIDRHPVLCYGVERVSQKQEGQLIQLSTIRWEDVVEQSPVIEENDLDAQLSRILGQVHQHLFEDQHQRPAWKITVAMSYTGESRVPSKFCVIFACHHAIADGSSGAAFQKTLYENLTGQSSPPIGKGSWPYAVPTKLPPPLFIENAFPLDRYLKLSSNDKDSAPAKKASSDPWTASPPFLKNIHDYVSRAHIVTIPSSQIFNILTCCRQRSITVTGLLHGLIVVHLANRVKVAKAFKATTPYSLRRFSLVSNDEIVNHVSGIVSEWDEQLLVAARSSIEGSAEEEKVIEKIAKQYQAEISEEMALMPERGPVQLLEGFQLEDLDKFCEDVLKRKRGNTYELSNVGVVQMIDGKDDIKLEKLVFSQCGTVAGPAIGCSVISTKGGPLVLCLSWQEGVLDEELMDSLRTFLGRRLLDV